MSSSDLVLKIRIQHAGGDVEQFRKRVDRGTFSLEALHEKVLALSTDFVPGATPISYADADGDEIHISTDEDLLEAQIVMTEEKRKTLELSVRILSARERQQEQKPVEAAGKDQSPAAATDARSSSSSVDSPPEQQQVHWGIECDASGQNPIIGKRFKKIGRDYDLCEAEFLKLPDAEKKLFKEVNCAHPRYQNRAPCGGYFPFPAKCAAGSAPDVLEELLAQPAFPALLRAAASTLEAKAAAGPVNPTEVVRQLWSQPEGQAVVQWLKTREPQLGFFIDIIHAKIQSQGQGQAENQRSAASGTSSCPRRRRRGGPFIFQDILRHINIEEVLQHAQQFEHMFAQAQGDSDSTEVSADDNTVNLQAAIEKSMSKTGTNDAAKKEAAERVAEKEAIANPAGSAPGDGAETAGAELPASIVPQVGPRPAPQASSDNAPYNEEVQLLKSMGFHDEEAVRAALKATDGNVQYAVNRLLL